MKVFIKDERISGKVSTQFELDMEEGKPVSLQDMIRLEIYGEVELYNQKRSEYFNGLVQPSDSEKELNGYILHNKRTVNPEKQYYLVQDAFQKNRFL